jgi:hypothetical protein
MAARSRSDSGTANRAPAQRTSSVCTAASVRGSESSPYVDRPDSERTRIRPPRASTWDRTASGPTPRLETAVVFSTVENPGRVTSRRASSSESAVASARMSADRRRCSRITSSERPTRPPSRSARTRTRRTDPVARRSAGAAAARWSRASERNRSRQRDGSTNHLELQVRSVPSPAAAAASARRIAQGSRTGSASAPIRSRSEWSPGSVASCESSAARAVAHIGSGRRGEPSERPRFEGRGSVTGPRPARLTAPPVPPRMPCLHKSLKGNT